MRERRGVAAVVVVGMSVRELQARDELRAWAAGHDASLAFLQLGDPSLARELTRLADDGVERIEIVGVSLGTLAPAVSWLRRVTSYWWRERPGHRPDVLVGERLVASAAELTTVLSTLREISGAEAPLTSAAWEDVTAHRHQVLVCRGPRCTAQGSDLTAEAVILELMAQGQSDDDVLVTHTGCQFPCNQAPVISVQPDDVWYGAVTPTVAREITASHLVGGVPVESHRLPR